VYPLISVTDMSDRWIHTLRLRLRSLFLGSQVERELDDELRFHVEQLIEEQIARGVPPDEARYAALRTMDGIDQQKERCRDTRRVRLVENAAHDLRYALRLMRRSPGFTAVALLSLTLGIGANTAMFQLLDAIGLRALPVDRPHELAEVRIAGGNGGFGVTENSNSQMTNPLWEALRDHQEAFSGIFAWGDTNALVGRGADMRAVRLLWVSGEFFPVLGIHAGRGRLFVSADDHRDCGTQGVVISDAFWRSYFGGSESAIGGNLPILDRSVPVIGVTPPEFFGLEVGRQFDIALPICAAGGFPRSSLDRRNAFWLTVMGRLKPVWTLARAAAHVDALSPGLIEATMPPGYDANGMARYRSFRLTALSASQGVSEWRTRYGPALWWLLGTTGMVLLIACANISNLLLARATAREREIGIRIAIGATRARLLGQMLVEGALLAGIGAAAGTVLAGVMSRAMVAMLTTEGDRLLLHIATDWRVLAFTGAVAVVACVVFALVPAVRSSHAQAVAAMHTRTAGAAVSRRGAFQRVMVAGQIALALVLLVAALLFIRSFRNLTSVETGLRLDGVILANVGRLAQLRQTSEEILAFERTLLEQIRSIPRVEAAAASTQFPLNGSSWTQGVLVADANGLQRKSSKFTYVSPGYFSTLGIPLRVGHDFSDADTASSRRVAIVNETFARRYSPGADPIGLLVRTTAEPGFPEATYEVVGLAGDTTYASVRDEVPPIAYVPIPQHPSLRPWPGMLIRTSTAPADVIPEIKRRISAIDPTIVMRFSVLETEMRDRMVRERTMAWLAGGFGVLATLLATIGLYGVIAYMATGRKHEIGVRRALGASRAVIVRLILTETIVILALGVPVGLLAARVVVRGAGSLVFGLSVNDPLTLVGCAGLLAAAAIAASAIPAVRASRADPMDALRCE
jgi:predicted permease